MKPNPGSAFRKFTIAVAVVTVVGSTRSDRSRNRHNSSITEPRGNCGCNYSNDVAGWMSSGQVAGNNGRERERESKNTDVKLMTHVTTTTTNEKNGKRKFSQRLKAFHLLPTLLLLSLPADNAVFIHRCSFPSGHPSISLCAARVSARDGGEKSSSCEKGFSLAKAGRRKAIHLDNNNNTTRT